MAKNRSQYPLSLVWLAAYLDIGSPTFLNASAAAVKAGYKAKNGRCFAQIGYKNKKRYESKISEWLEEHGFSEIQLKTKVLELMEAKETKIEKIKGAILQSSLPEGCRVLTTSGTVVTEKDGVAYGDGDTLLAIDVAALETQRKTLDMALKMKGLYAPEKHKHSGAVATILQFTDADRELARKVIDSSIKKLMEAEHAKPA